jgi:hypothetical protein
MSMLHLGWRLLPLVKPFHDFLGLLMVGAGFGISSMAMARLGAIRTYFGTELGFVKPQWVNRFPYGSILHPMIVGQIIAFSSFLYWWQRELSLNNILLFTFGCPHCVLYHRHASRYS